VLNHFSSKNVLKRVFLYFTDLKNQASFHLEITRRFDFISNHYYQLGFVLEDAVGHRYFTDKQIFKAKLENFLSRQFVPGGYFGEQAPEKSIEEAVAQLTKNFEESLAEESGVDPEKITEIPENQENNENITDLKVTENQEKPEIITDLKITENQENTEATKDLNDSENPEDATLAASLNCDK